MYVNNNLPEMGNSCHSIIKNYTPIFFNGIHFIYLYLKLQYKQAVEMMVFTAETEKTQFIVQQISHSVYFVRNPEEVLFIFRPYLKGGLYKSAGQKTI